MHEELNMEPKPPDTYLEFTERYPALGEAWKMTQKAGDSGPLDGKTARLVKLGIAMGTMRESPVRTAIRKGVPKGMTTEEIDQAIALVAGTLGFPSTVAIYSWVRDELAKIAAKGANDSTNV